MKTHPISDISTFADIRYLQACNITYRYRSIYWHALDNRYRHIGFADMAYIGRYISIGRYRYANPAF